MKNIFLLLIAIEFVACTNNSVESKYYSSLVDKEWTIQTREKLWNTCTLDLTLKNILIDSITKNRKDKDRDPHYFLHELIFKKDGKIEYSEVVKNLILCGNGLLEINSGKWQLDDNILTINIEGGYAMEFKFHYKIEYEISFPNDNEMKLRKVKNITWDQE